MVGPDAVVGNWDNWNLLLTSARLHNISELEQILVDSWSTYIRAQVEYVSFCRLLN